MDNKNRFMNRCNGYSFADERVEFSSAAMDAFNMVVGGCRKAFSKMLDEGTLHGNNYHDNYYLGRRFSTDRDVVLRVTSAMDNEAEFMADPAGWVMDALRDCASADHWYEFEKDWG